jgi:hypothetical protein
MCSSSAGGGTVIQADRCSRVNLLVMAVIGLR